jgi:hypothetical protein
MSRPLAKTAETKRRARAKERIFLGRIVLEKTERKNQGQKEIITPLSARKKRVLEKK